MPTLPIHLEVEAEAVGPVLIALRKMPGIIKLHLDLGEGAAALPKPNGGMSIAEATMAFMVKHKGGPVHIQQIQHEIGGNKTRAYGVLHTLKKAGAVTGAGKGQWQLSPKAMAAAGLRLALPKPKAAKKAKVVKTATGRAAQGSGPATLIELLTKEAMTGGAIRVALQAKGLSAKSTSGILTRTRRDGLVKRRADGLYELTAKGSKVETTTEA